MSTNGGSYADMPEIRMMTFRIIGVEKTEGRYPFRRHQSRRGDVGDGNQAIWLGLRRGITQPLRAAPLGL